MTDPVHRSPIRGAVYTPCCGRSPLALPWTDRITNDAELVTCTDGGPWVDKQGDVWTLADDGLLRSPETAPFSRLHVEEKWGPLQPAAAVAELSRRDLYRELIGLADSLDEHVTADDVRSALADLARKLRPGFRPLKPLHPPAADLPPSDMLI